MNEQIDALRRAEELPPALRRHALIVAVRAAIEDVADKRSWIGELGHDDYMCLQWDVDFVDQEPTYWFAESICYAMARLRGVDAQVMDELKPPELASGSNVARMVHPSGHGMDAVAMEQILGSLMRALEKRVAPDLNAWWDFVTGPMP